MLKRKYRKVIGAVLAGAVLFSPLLCGMTCVETRVEGAKAAVEAAAPAEELVGELAKSAVVACVLTHVVLNIELGKWAEGLNEGNWVWVGVVAVRLIGAIERGWRG